MGREGEGEGEEGEGEGEGEGRAETHQFFTGDILKAEDLFGTVVHDEDARHVSYSSL